MLPVILLFALQGVFLTIAPYIVMQEYGLSPVAFGVSNIAIVIGLFLGRWAGARLFAKCQKRCVYRYSLLFGLFATILFVFFAIHIIYGLWEFLFITAAFAFFTGMVTPVGMKTSIAAFASNSGIAAALQGSMLFAAFAIGSITVGSLIKLFSSTEFSIIYGIIAAILLFATSIALIQDNNK